MDVQKAMSNLKQQRMVFHSEADFQFALAWELQKLYPSAHVRLEYCPKEAPNMHIDILVHMNDRWYPIELKYKTLHLVTEIDKEAYQLKSHGAQDIGKYDCLVDLRRIEWLSQHLPGYHKGYTIWLSNDPSYWTKPSRNHTIYEAFSVHHLARKSGALAWADHAGPGTTRGREKPIVLNGQYTIHWEPYSVLGVKRNETFQYALLFV